MGTPNDFTGMNSGGALLVRLPSSCETSETTTRSFALDGSNFGASGVGRPADAFLPLEGAGGA